MATSAPSTRGPYAKTAAVRQRILDAAIDVFAVSGFRASTMKDIAERAGISQRGLAHHFGSKFELLSAVLAAREQESATLMAPFGSTIDAFDSMLDVVADNSRRPGLVELYSILAAEGVDEEHPAHGHHRGRYLGLKQYFGAAFESLRESGELNAELDSDSLAIAFVGLIEGLQLQWLYDRDAVDMDAILKAFLVSVIPRYDELRPSTVNPPSDVAGLPA